MRAKIIGLLVLLLALTPGLALAQSPSVEFNRWDATINVQQNTNQMKIAETQEIRVTNGTLTRGQRFWTTPVQVQNVYVAAADGNPVQLSNSNQGNSPGTYSVSESGGRTTLNYTLPGQVRAGDTFVVQINYTATSSTSGMVDWKIVPAEHNFNVRSSTVNVRFPQGQAPDPSLARATGGNANAQVNGNELVIQSNGPIAAGQAFAVQIPYGANVGQAGGSNNSNNPNNNFGSNPNAPLNPSDNTQAVQLPGIGTILLILCIVGFLLLWGGGSLLRRLLGGFLGGNTLGNAPGSFGRRPGYGPFGGANNAGNAQPPYSAGRGFRPSANQDRDLGDIGSDKDSGGGASFS